MELIWCPFQLAAGQKHVRAASYLRNLTSRIARRERQASLVAETEGQVGASTSSEKESAAVAAGEEVAPKGDVESQEEEEDDEGEHHRREQSLLSLSSLVAKLRLGSERSR